MSGEKKLNMRLRRERQLRGWSQQKVAGLLDTSEDAVSRWERGERKPSPFFQEKFCILYGKSAEELGFLLQNEYDVLESLGESDFSAFRRRIAIKRRELLQLLGVASSALFIPGIDWDHIEASIAKPTCIDAALVNDLEAINNHFWSLFKVAPSKYAVLDGVLGQLRMQSQFFKEPQSTQTHQCLYTQVSSMSQLAGEIFFDLHDYSAAQSCYTFAATAAREAKAYDLWASALVRNAYLPLFDEHYEDALELLRQAEHVVQRGDAALPTKYWIAATRAEAEAGINNFNGCESAFEKAYGVHNLKEESPAWVRFDGSRLPALQGACYVRLKLPDQAEPMLQRALQESAKTNRRRAMILADLALFALQQTDIEKACVYTDEVITLASTSASSFLRNSILKIEKLLIPFSEVEAVKNLEKRIVSFI